MAKLNKPNKKAIALLALSFVLGSILTFVSAEFERHQPNDASGIHAKHNGPSNYESENLKPVGSDKQRTDRFSLHSIIGEFGASAKTLYCQRCRLAFVFNEYYSPTRSMRLRL
jgi:hypothetical protein